jgi:hypothetical protein
MASTIAAVTMGLVMNLLGLRICEIPALQRLQKHQDPTDRVAVSRHDVTVRPTTAIGSNFAGHDG